MVHLPGTMPDPGKRRVRRPPRSKSAASLPSLQVSHSNHEGHTPSTRGLGSWWPLALGIAIACVAPQLRDALAAWEPWGMRLVFPYVLLCGKHELGLSEEMARMLPQIMLFLQFPLEGLLTKITMSRGVRLPGAIGQLILVHLLGAVVLTLIAMPAP